MRTIIVRVTCGVALLLGHFLSRPEASAAVTYKFSGVVTAVSSQISFEFHQGEIVSGQMDLTLNVAEFDRAFYDVTNLAANIGGDYPITSTGGTVKVLNNFGGSTDLAGLDVTSQNNGLNAHAVAGHVPDYFSFTLIYNSINDLTSVNLIPQFVFNSPNDLSNLRFDVNDSIEVQFHLNDWSAVPEPPALALVLISIPAIGLAIVRRTPSRNHRASRPR